jgi:rhodanese-related sulfurtransferase
MLRTKKKSSNSDLNPNPSQAFEIIEKNENNPDFVVLDVRTTGEFEEGHISGSELLDYRSPDFQNKLQKMDKNKKYLLYCHSGMRSAKSAKIMKKMGFKDVRDILGGFQAWKTFQLPIEKSP